MADVNRMSEMGEVDGSAYGDRIRYASDSCEGDKGLKPRSRGHALSTPDAAEAERFSLGRQLRDELSGKH